MTTPIFIVGSGRCGTKLIYKLLHEFSEVRSHHEYQIHRIQSLACKWQMRLISEQETTKELLHVYRTAAIFEDRRLWANSCNKASWLIPLIDKVFPNAKFIHLIRDGRRVVSSYYHKLADECYANQDVETLRRWVYGDLEFAPPNEKRYWWPIPPDDFGNYDRFMRICWHWQTIVSEITAQLNDISAKRTLTLRLEDFVSKENIFCSLFDFIGLSEYPNLFEIAQVPINVREAKSYKLTPDQEKTFQKICGRTMTQFGYTGLDYLVTYENSEQAKRPIYTY